MTLETFYQQFGLLADAPNAVQKLREMVLQLAVQGKLGDISHYSPTTWDWMRLEDIGTWAIGSGFPKAFKVPPEKAFLSTKSVT